MIGVSVIRNSVNHGAAIAKAGTISHCICHGGKLDARAAGGVASAHSGKVNGFCKAVHLVAVKIVHKIAPLLNGHIASTIRGKQKVCDASNTESAI
jgi:hypothetical protein